MLKLSIIVPIYNVEPYLRKCVDSLLAQDLSPDEYEIILVDDGSPDGCPAICDEYASKYAFIHVLHRPNGGLSAARNSGLKVAKGKYVQFVDSDDYLEPNVLGGLVAQMEREDLDVLRFDYQNVRIVPSSSNEVNGSVTNRSVANSSNNVANSSVVSTYEIFQPYKHPHQVDKRTDVADGETYLNERLGYVCYAWQFVLRREMRADIIFTEGIHFEDVDWTPRMLLAAKRVNSTTTIVYNYLLREGSITRAIDVAKKKKNIDDMLRVIDTINAELTKHPYCQWLCRMRSVMASNILTTNARDMYDSYAQYLSQLKQKNALPLVIADQGQTYVRRARLINFSPKIFGLLMHLRK